MSPNGFHIPTLADVVNRPRLIRLVDSRPRCRIILVTGQAAQGKSTLVADYLHQQAAPSLWIHLTHSLSQGAKLFDRLSQGIANLTGPGRHAPLEPHVPLGPGQNLLRQADLLTAMLVRVNQPVNIVLDDMESLENGASTLELIQVLLGESPEFVRFFLLSRQRPELNFSRFKMKQQLMEITNQDLAFTLDETQAFFKESQDLAARQKTLEKIVDITNGWAGGLVLVLESVRRCLDLDQLPDELSSEAFSYFSQEIYQNLAPQQIDFLTQTAFFEELDTRILSGIFPDLDSRALLAALEKRNLFIQKIGRSRSWPVYRYNNLFRDFLRKDFLASRGKDAVISLNRKIGQVYWQEKDHEKAILYFQAAYDHEKIAKIIRIKGSHYVITGRADRLAQWISVLPGQLTAHDPWLIFFQTMAGRIKGGKDNITAFSTALDLFTKEKDTRGILLSLAYLIEAAVFIRQPSFVIIKWIQKGEDALARVGGAYRYTWARTLLWQQIGLGYIVGTGDIPKGISACKNATLLAQGIDNPDLLLNASVIMTLGLVQSGDFTGARQMLDRIKSSDQKGIHPEYRALENITSIDFALKKGDMDRAGALLDASEKEIEKFGLIFLYPAFVEARAIYLASCGQYHAAVQSADHLSDFSILEGNDFYLGISHRIKAMVCLLQKEYASALELADQAIAQLDQSRRGDIHLYQARQIKGFALYYLGTPEAAAQTLEPVLGYFDRINADLSFCETAFAAGLTALEYPDEVGPWAKMFEAAFESGLKKAVDSRYLYFSFVGEEMLAKVLVKGGERFESLRVHITDYLFGCDRKRLNAAVQERICDALNQAHTKQKNTKAAELLPLYKASCPRLFIQTFGAFRVYQDQDPISGAAFGGAKPMLLLKSIVAHQARDIPKEVLVDALWPEACAGAGEKNLKINLHRLRKGLEPFALKAFGHIYLIQKDGRVSLDPDLVRIDTAEFLRFAAQGTGCEKNQDWERALHAYENACSLYQGDYFQADPYLEWVDSRRQMFRRKIIEILEQKARLHEEMDQWDQAVESWKSVIQIDSCRESAYQNLMILYADAQMTARALDVFSQCKGVLKKELDVEPDSQTLEILKAIERR